MLELSFNQETVHKLLQASDKPLKAYNILFETQKLGIKSPTQVYRALDKLIEIGKVHKIESRNSYVACKHEGCSAKTSTSFLICENCDKVTELTGNNLFSYFSKQAEKNKFHYKKHSLEIYGLCESCKLKN